MRQILAKKTEKTAFSEQLLASDVLCFRHPARMRMDLQTMVMETSLGSRPKGGRARA
tara:strand:- start:260 stop:430 length:171 start_codon:yes stop_codon:yes gene_type:complete